MAPLAGVLYLLAAQSAILAENFLRGRLLHVAGLIPVALFAIVTLLLCQLLKSVNRNLAWLAAYFNLFGLMLKAFEWHFRGANVALVFHRLYVRFVTSVVTA
jgi:hypothetical protein